MARSVKAIQKALAVALHELIVLTGYAGAIGIANALVQREGSALATPRQLSGMLDARVPGVEQIEIGRVSAQTLVWRQSGGIIFSGEACDRQRGIDGVGQRTGTEIGTAGVTLALTEIDRDADALVAVVFDGVDILASHRDCLTVTLGDLHLAGTGTLVTRAQQYRTRHITQLFRWTGKAGGGSNSGSGRSRFGGRRGHGDYLCHRT